MTAESPLNAPELAEESTARPPSWPALAGKHPLQRGRPPAPADAAANVAADVQTVKTAVREGRRS